MVVRSSRGSRLLPMLIVALLLGLLGGCMGAPGANMVGRRPLSGEVPTPAAPPGVSAATPSSRAVVTSGTGVGTGGSKALVLYDTTGAYGWLGELYATGVANLASHFGSWTAKPVGAYTSGEVVHYTAVIYVGSTYDEPIPAAFLSDVLTADTTVIWVCNNIWQLTKQNPAAFTARYGWNAATAYFDRGAVGAVQYKGTTLTRNATNGAGILNPQTVGSAFDASKVTTLATAVRADGTTFPWAVRSGNLTYIGENPLTFLKEEDRYLAFADLLFDALAPGTATRHRAMVRLEDLNPQSDPAKLRQIADYLASQGVPFGFGLSPVYLNPLGFRPNASCTPGAQCGPAATVSLKDRPELVKAIQYAQSKGGVLVLHGYTHQWDGGINPYNGATGADYEFYRVTENADHTLNYTGPIPGDSVAWADGRIAAAIKAIGDAGLSQPTLFEFPHYSASAADYQAVGARFAARWERSFYFNGLLSGGTVSYGRSFTQFFPYAVRDVYGTVVLPENLGNFASETFYQYPTRSPADLINAAEKNLVVRDGVACFYYHPDFVPLSYLQDTISGIKDLGYTFIAPMAAIP